MVQKHTKRTMKIVSSIQVNSLVNFKVIYLVVPGFKKS